MLVNCHAMYKTLDKCNILTANLLVFFNETNALNAVYMGFPVGVLIALLITNV